MSAMGGGAEQGQRSAVLVTAEELQRGLDLFRDRYLAYRQERERDAERRQAELVAQAINERAQRQHELELAAESFSRVRPALAQDAEYRRAQSDLVNFTRSLSDRPLPATNSGEPREEVSLDERHQAEDKRLNQILAEMARADERVLRRELERTQREQPSREGERERERDRGGHSILEGR